MSSPPPPPRGPPNSSPFWSFNLPPEGVRPSAGDGVDHITPEGFGPSFPPGFPFGPGGFWASPWGPHGHGHGHRHPGRRGGWHQSPWTYEGAADSTNDNGNNNNENNNNDNNNNTDEMRDAADAAATAGDPEKIDEPRPQDAQDGENTGHAQHRYGHPRRGGGGGCRGGGGRGRGAHFRCGGFPHHPPPSFGWPGAGAGGPGGAFDLRGMMAAFANHPYAQQLREYLERAQNQAQNQNRAADGSSSSEEEDDGFDSERFTPPVDVFDGAGFWTVHVALPGARKEDVGVHWEADSSSLAISGVVYRPGDEEFIAGLVSGERKVGLFNRKIKLPPAAKNGHQKKDEVDSDGIAAKMQDGVLIVVVPKVEKEWTEVRKVEIE